MLSDEQMSKRWPFSLLNDEQMSNKVGVEHQPDIHISTSGTGKTHRLKSVLGGKKICVFSRYLEHICLEDHPS